MKKYNNSYYDYFIYYLLPQAIEYGMTNEQFWYDDPQLFVSYRNAFIEKKKREFEEMNYYCWLSGLYIYDGNSRLLGRVNQTIFNGFQGFSSKPKFDEENFGTYREKPFDFNNTEKENEKEITKKTKYQEYQNSLKTYGSIKKIYLEKKLREV